MKKPSTRRVKGFLWGLKRIRTAVRGFADLCLATRPSDHFFRFGLQIYKLFFNLQNLIHFSLNNSWFSFKNSLETLKMSPKRGEIGEDDRFFDTFFAFMEKLFVVNVYGLALANAFFRQITKNEFFGIFLLTNIIKCGIIFKVSRG